MTQAILDPTAIDNELSKRHIDLDPGGYFLIFLDREAGLIHADHYTNDINEQGLACDPETGEPLPCNGQLKRRPAYQFSGRTAKEVCVKIFEQWQPCAITMLDHAAYLGRELQRAEQALLQGRDYIQD